MRNEFIKTEWMGKVALRHIKADRMNAPVYSDGPVENELYYRLKCNPNYGTGDDHIKFPSWAHGYHLSPLRQNLLKWFPFRPDANVLEIGAGCGALTGLLCEKLSKVTALEYSYPRARVIAQRHSRYSNLEVVVGRLQDYKNEEQFDYVTVIGVLEYAGTFYGGKMPYESFLAKARSLLKPEGTLILAIENKIGLKYICGAPEDHTGRIFDSLYDYPYPCKVRTFSKKELTSLMHAAGFYHLKWYYPLPDYKMPQEVLSEEISPTDLDSIWRLFPAVTRGCERKEILSEKTLGKTIARAGLFGEFANSFLVVARTEQKEEKFKCLRFRGANKVRKPEYQANIRVCVKDQEKIVIRKAESCKAKAFIQEITKKEIWAKSFLAGKAEVVTGRLDGSCLYYPYIDLPSLEDLIAKAIKNGDPNSGKSLIEDYKHFLYNLPVETCVPDKFMREFNIKSRMNMKPVDCLRIALLDCIPRNIKVSEEKWYIIDNEWTYDFPLPIDYLIFRGIITLITDLQAQVQHGVSKDRPVAIFRGYGKRRQYIPCSWLEILQTMKIPIDEMAYWEMQFDNHVLSTSKNLRVRLKKNTKMLIRVVRLRLKKKPKALTRVAITEIKTSPEILYEIRSILRKVKNRFLRVLSLL